MSTRESLRKKLEDLRRLMDDKSINDHERDAAQHAAREVEEHLARETALAATDQQADEARGAPEMGTDKSAQPPLEAFPPVPAAELTDLGNAERMAAWHGHDIRFCKSLDWMVHDSQRWVRDETGEVMRRAKGTVRFMLSQARTWEGPQNQRNRYEKHCLKSQAARRLAGMINLVQSERSIAVRAHEFDADPWLLNVVNGTIDLRTGVLREHRREDLITKLAPVTYDPSAKCPRWERFLEEVQPDASVRGYMKRLCGYAITGVIRDHVLPVNCGKGRNGKGVFTNTLQFMLGDYATTVPTELLMAKKNDQHPTERMTLLGRRLAVATETEENRQLATALVKQLTGGDPISARLVHRDFVTFNPTHKLMLATNNRPIIRETTDAIWERVHLIPWSMTFTGTSADETLGEKLKGEAAGILRWAIEGCLEWQRVGLDPPEIIVAATAHYRADMDVLGDFLAELCVLAPEARVSRAALRSAYEAWCAEVGEKFPLGAKTFAERLRERSITDVPSMRAPGKKTPVRGWEGIRLRVPTDDVAPTDGTGQPGQPAAANGVGTYPPGDTSSGAPPTDATASGDLEENDDEVSTRVYVTTSDPDSEREDLDL